ncbi:hypothetical protein LUZ60_010203 [Juncus effusus]|nr:hypothetical protein LUZ60_010203 [Juncus effusus]
MAHGGYARRRVEERRPVSNGRRPKPKQKGALGPDNKKRKKLKSVSIKNQIRSAERFLRKELPGEVREAQQKKLDELKRQQEEQNRLAIMRKIQLRDRKIKFVERRKIERMIRRLEKQQRSTSDQVAEGQIISQLSKLKEDLEYIRFFPKNEKYVSLFTGADNSATIEKRNKWREEIKKNLIEAAASGKDLEETGSDEDALDTSDDDFFMSGSSSDEAEADDELTDKSTKEPASSAGKGLSGMSSDEKNQRQRSARVLMPPPRSLPPSRARMLEKRQTNSHSTSDNNSSSTSGPSRSSNGPSRSSRPAFNARGIGGGGDHDMSGPSRSSRPARGGDHSMGGASRSSSRQAFNAGVGSGGDHSMGSNLSSNSDAQKPRRKRRHRKKKKQV